MKRLIRAIRATEDIFAMSKIVDKYAIPSISKEIGKFVYFSPSNSSHGPRIKFYGGSKETSSTMDAPTLAYTTEGQCTLELADWMNRKNCPNAFDQDYLSNLESFVQHNKAILLLVWFKHLDEADALAYFHGQISFTDLLSNIDFVVPSNIMSIDGLDQYCINNNLYSF